MKKTLLSLTVLALIFGACSTEEKAGASNEESVSITDADKEPSQNTGVISPSMYGAEVTVEEVTVSEDLIAQLSNSDTLRNIVISGKIKNVCKKKGCWMKVDIGDEKEVFVKFLDYEFFMPKDSDGSTAIIQGNAYAEIVSVEDLQHYAEDDGKSEEEIAAITESETTYSFMASGVILKDYVQKEKMEIPEKEDGEDSNKEEHDHSEEGHSH